MVKSEFVKLFLEFFKGIKTGLNGGLRLRKTKPERKRNLYRYRYALFQKERGHESLHAPCFDTDRPELTRPPGLFVYGAFLTQLRAPFWNGNNTENQVKKVSAIITGKPFMAWIGQIFMKTPNFLRAFPG